MPSNRFDTSEKQSYVSSYIPLPFQQLAALGEQAKADFDEGKKLETDLDALSAAIKAAPSYKASRKAYVDSVNKQLRNAIEEAKGDYGNSDFKQKVRNITNEFKNSTQVANFQKTLEAFNIWEKLKAQGDSKDLDYTYEMEADNPNEFKQLDILENPIYSSRFTKYSDWDKAAKEVAGHIAPSGGETIGDLLAKTSMSGGTLYERHGNSWRGVTDNKLVEVVNKVIPNYASTSAGQHHFETILRKDYNFGNNAYNVSYLDLKNNSDAAQIRISKGEGTAEDQKVVEMKKDIDTKLFNHVKAANQYQVGTIIDKTVQDQFIKNPEPSSGSGSGEDKNNPNKNPWNLASANPDPVKDPINSALKKANPNTVFSFDENGKMNFVKPGDTGFVDRVTYKDKNGTVWDPQHPPAGWRYEIAPRTTTTLLLTDEERGHFVSTGGTVFNPLQQLGSSSRNVKKVRNTEIYARQVQEVMTWAIATGQITLDKNGKDQYGRLGSDQYKDLLPKYEAAIRNGVMNTQYVPQFDAETAANFKDVFAPKFTTTKEGETIMKDPGLVSSWSIDGVNTKEEKQNILNDFNVIGLDMVKGGSNILIESGFDGKQHSVNMNNPTLAATFNNLSRFIRDNNTAKLNPTTVDNKNILNSVSNYFNNLTENAINQGADKNHVQESARNLISDYTNAANYFTKNGYVQTSVYKDPSSGIIGISFINHSAPGGQDVKVIKYDPSTDDSFEMISEASFNREIQQKSIGNFASNLNKKGSKTNASFIDNQVEKP